MISLRLLVWATLLGGCGGKRDAAQGGDGAPVDGDQDTAAGDAGEDTAPEPMWWRFDADLVVADGLPVVESSSVQVTIIDDGLSEVCAGTAALAAAEEGKPGGEGAALVAFDLEVGAWATECAADAWDAWFPPLDGSFSLGFGAMHPELVAALVGLSGTGEGAADALNGAYLSTRTDPEVVAFGVAGPSAAYQGEGEPLEAGPVPDGDWYVRGLFALAL